MCILKFEVNPEIYFENDPEALRNYAESTLTVLINFETKEAEFVVVPIEKNLSNYPYETDDFEGALDLFNDYKTDNGGGSPIYIVDIVCNNIIGDDVINEDVKESIKSLLQSTNSNIENCTCYRNFLHIQFQHFNYIFTYDNPELFIYDDPLDEEERKMLISKLEKIKEKYQLTEEEKEIVENFFN